MTTIEDLFGKIKTPVRSVTICLDADLTAEWDELREKLDALGPATKMADAAEGRQIAERMRDLEQAMRDSEHTFKFKGISAHALAALQDRFPPREGKRETWNVIDGAPALLAACAVEPAMTEAQAATLVDRLSHGQADKLITCAWMATVGNQTVPFSARASELLAGNGSK